MNNKELITSITEFSKSKNIDRPTLISMIEDMLRSLILKRYGTDINFDISIKPDKGELKISRYRTVVSDDTKDLDPIYHITLADARKILPDFEVGEECTESITVDQFDRRDILQALQVFLQKEKKIEQTQLYEKYKKLVGKIINVEVFHANPYKSSAMLRDDDKNTLILPKSNQIPGEVLKEGSYIKALVEEIIPTTHSLKIILSRTSGLFLEQLLIHEIPEMTEGIVQIKKIARIPGVRSKVTVDSQYDHVPALGACLGINASRIHYIAKHELNNEKINLVEHTDKIPILVKRLMQPEAEVTSVKEDGNRIIVSMRPDQVPLAIGKKGQNIFLIEKILGKKVQIDREITHQNKIDIPLQEFKEIIDSKTLNALKEIGIDTARSLLYAEKEDIIRRTGIAASQLDTIMHTIQTKLST